MRPRAQFPHKASAALSRTRVLFGRSSSDRLTARFDCAGGKQHSYRLAVVGCPGVEEGTSEWSHPVNPQRGWLIPGLRGRPAAGVAGGDQLSGQDVFVWPRGWLRSRLRKGAASAQVQGLAGGRGCPVRGRLAGCTNSIACGHCCESRAHRHVQ
jgi:hypothetical protein